MQRYDRTVYLKQLLGRFGRFAAVGGVATALHYLLLVALVELFGVDEILSSAIAFSISSVANYFLNFYLTFAADLPHRQALPKFVLVAGLGLVVNTLCFTLLLPFLPYLLAQAGATLVTLASNFLLQQFWIYRGPQWNS
ncbi:GtrA family protein [Microbulbifer bruguierae]|uniref:GtrA family protein n=1 Tax=Microbulbifer bruguierae TaxID=3029061 RepID=A0ABY8NDX3_9GAMM|nr:GtrA family protein [Microbulbifer bruguierae]WGL16639.1 GtrA family protein [Microbulbifer bruguierae]